LQRLASQEGRSMNKQIVQALRDMIENRRRSAARRTAAA
jgi:hypothetical protein